MSKIPQTYPSSNYQPVPYPVIKPPSPANLEIEQPVLLSKKATIAVIDNFSNRVVDVNGDNIPDITHGGSVILQILGRISNADILTLNSAFSPSDLEHLGADSSKVEINRAVDGSVRRNMLKQIKHVEALVLQKKTVDAVNLSASLPIPGSMQPVTIEHLAKVTGLPLTSGNLSENREKIRESLKSLYDRRSTGTLTELQKDFSEIWPLIEGLDRLTELKIPVYIGAGNNPEEINLLGLAKNVKLVGSKDAEGKPSSFSAVNGLVNYHARGEFLSLPVYAGKTVIGFDITGDGLLDIPAKFVSNGGALPQPYTPPILEGTSLSAPIALAQDLIKKAKE